MRLTKEREAHIRNYPTWTSRDGQIVDLLAEIDALRADSLETFLATRDDFNERERIILGLMKERDALRAESKRNTSVHLWNEAYMDLQKERDALKSLLDDLAKRTFPGEVDSADALVKMREERDNALESVVDFTQMMHGALFDNNARILKLRNELSTVKLFLDGIKYEVNAAIYTRINGCRNSISLALAADEEGK